jgi:hypothetical protein
VRGFKETLHLLINAEINNIFAQTTECHCLAGIYFVAAGQGQWPVIIASSCVFGVLRGFLPRTPGHETGE